MVAVRKVDAADAEARLDAFAALLADGVASGASISFMWPFSESDAADWWPSVFSAVADGDAVLFGAFDDADRLIGTVQLGLDGPCNQRHRGDVRKLIVHRGARGKGVGAALMAALEAEARERGLKLLTLDTATDGAADRLYRRLGWTPAGSIPHFALMPDGAPCATTIFYRPLGD